MLGRIIRKIKAIFFKIIFPRFREAVLFDVPKVYHMEKLTIGKNVHINDNVFINAAGRVSIGNYGVLSHGVTILSTGLDTSKWLNRIENEDLHIERPVVIGDNVWIGANTTICPGVSIAANTIIAAGAVVSKSIEEEGCLYGGVPAKKLKEL